MKDLSKVLSHLRDKKLLAVFPHPDDESFATGALLQVAKKFGAYTNVITLTKGDKGQNYLPHSTQPLSQIRSQELKEACELLNVDNLTNLDFPDGNLKGCISDWSKYLTDYLEKEKPELIVTYDHSGFTGHPDHIILSVELLKIVKDLSYKPKLIWFTINKPLEKAFNQLPVAKYRNESNIRLDYDFATGLKKAKAFLKHRCQLKSYRDRLEIILYALVWRYELYHEVDLEKDYVYDFMDFKI